MPPAQLLFIRIVYSITSHFLSISKIMTIYLMTFIISFKYNLMCVACIVRNISGMFIQVKMNADLKHYFKIFLFTLI